MDENADVSQVIFEPPPESWRRPPGWPCTTWMRTIQGDLSCLDLELNESRELAQNRPLWRLISLYSATHLYWCMLLLDWNSLAGVRGGPILTPIELFLTFAYLCVTFSENQQK